MSDLDVPFYLFIYEDLIKNGVTTEQSARMHYKSLGIKEKRIPNKSRFYTFYPTFDYKQYGKHFNISSEMEAIKHFLTQSNNKTYKKEIQIQELLNSIKL